MNESTPGRRPKSAGPQTHKRCPKCKKVKERRFFNIRKNGTTLQSYCKECSSGYGCEYAAKNPDKHRESNKNWYWRNHNRARELAKHQYIKAISANPEFNKDRHRKNADSSRESRREYYRKNKQKMSQKFKAWRESNLDKCRERSMRYEAAKRNAVPSWFDKGSVESVYKAAKSLTHAWGVALHVDHVVPLSSEVVCGLHVHDNLQLLEPSINQKKSNTIWPDMP